MFYRHETYCHVYLKHPSPLPTKKKRGVQTTNACMELIYRVRGFKVSRLRLLVPHQLFIKLTRANVNVTGIVYGYIKNTVAT